jgi:hypothetical protein
MSIFLTISWRKIGLGNARTNSTGERWMSNFFSGCGVESYRLVFIDDCKNVERAWFGGAAPIGVSPARNPTEFSFLFTIPLSDTECVSVFHRGVDAKALFDSLFNCRRIQDEMSDHVQFVVHPVASPGPLKDDFVHCAALVLSDEYRTDGDLIDEYDEWFEEDMYMDMIDDTLCEDSKCGGLPAFYQVNRESLELLNLMRDGFRLCLQLSWPIGAGHSWSTSWIPGEWKCHLLGRKSAPNSPWEFRWQIG